MNFVVGKTEATQAPAPPRELSTLARAIAAEPVANAISPVVLIGLVRLVEFLGGAAIGAATYTAYVYPYDETSLSYAAAILLISAAAVLALGDGHPIPDNDCALRIRSDWHRLLCFWWCV